MLGPHVATKMTRNTRYPIKSTQTSFRLVEVLAERGPLGVTELAAELDTSKSSIHNHLSTLEGLGYVGRDGSRYVLGMRFLSLGRRSRRRIEGFDRLREELRNLHRATGESVNLVAREGSYGVCAFAVVSDSGSRFAEGDRFPLPTTTTGRAILSQLDGETVDEVISEYSNDGQSVRRSIQRVNENGILFSKEERDPAYRSVVAPVGNDRGPALAVEISGAASELKGRRLEEDLVGLLLSTVKKLNLALS